jgi:hypothetical protein
MEAKRGLMLPKLATYGGFITLDVFSPWNELKRVQATMNTTVG